MGYGMSEKGLSALILEHVVFDQIEFQRTGFKNDNEAEYELQVEIGSKADKSSHRVSLKLDADKKDEYTIRIVLSGFFRVEKKELSAEIKIEELLKKNAVAILMPYLRSEVSLLTAQPETESLVFPVFNINAMYDGE